MRPTKKYDVVISGMGPAALAAAYEAASAGKTVLMISDRSDDFYRPQRVIFEDEIKKYLIKMALTCGLVGRQTSEEDVLFRHKFFRELHRGFIAIKEVERYLYKLLKNHFSGFVSFLFHSELHDLNLELGCCSTKKTKTSIEEDSFDIVFDYLIGADGAKHHSLNVFNEKHPNHKISQVDVTPHTGLTREEHFSAYLLLRKKEGGAVSFPSDIDALKCKTHPLVGVFFDISDNEKNDKQLKFNIGGELPADIREMKDPHKKKYALMSYIKARLFALLEKKSINTDELEIHEIKPSEKHGEAKDRLKFSFFEREFKKTERAAIELNGFGFFLTGDAFLTPDYQIGSGLNAALIESAGLHDVFRQEISEGVESHNALCERIADHDINTSRKNALS